jgi:small subunit ribosomal protein S17
MSEDETRIEEPPLEAGAPDEVAEAEQPEPEAAAEGAPLGDTEPVDEVDEEPDAGAESTEAGAAGASAKRKRKRLPRALRRQRTKAKRTKPAEPKPIARLPKPERKRGHRQERQGTVVSAAADRTIVVRVDVVKLHPRYKKVVKRSTRLHAHDEQNVAKVGDLVRIVETRPLSRMKRWRLQEVVEAAK